MCYALSLKLFNTRFESLVASLVLKHAYSIVLDHMSQKLNQTVHLMQ